jgi:hypothetical protein
VTKRAREPDRVDEIERDGVRVGFEVYGDTDAAAAPTVVLLASWAIVRDRQWKAQVPLPPAQP